MSSSSSARSKLACGSGLSSAQGKFSPTSLCCRGYSRGFYPGVAGLQKFAPRVGRRNVDALTRRLEQPPLSSCRHPRPLWGGVKARFSLPGWFLPLWHSFPEGRSTLPVLVKSYRDWPGAINQALEVSLQHQQGRVPDDTILLGAPRSAPRGLFERLQSLVAGEISGRWCWYLTSSKNSLSKQPTLTSGVEVLTNF